MLRIGDDMFFWINGVFVGRYPLWNKEKQDKWWEGIDPTLID